jgi:hypothetical protein
MSIPNPQSPSPYAPTHRPTPARRLASPRARTPLARLGDAPTEQHITDLYTTTPLEIAA